VAELEQELAQYKVQSQIRLAELEGRLAMLPLPRAAPASRKAAPEPLDEQGMEYALARAQEGLMVEKMGAFLLTGRLDAALAKAASLQEENALWRKGDHMAEHLQAKLDTLRSKLLAERITRRDAEENVASQEAHALSMEESLLQLKAELTSSVDKQDQISREFEDQRSEREANAGVLETRASAAEEALKASQGRVEALGDELTVCQGALQAGVREHFQSKEAPSEAGSSTAPTTAGETPEETRASLRYARLARLMQGLVLGREVLAAQETAAAAVKEQEAQQAMVMQLSQALVELSKKSATKQDDAAAAETTPSTEKPYDGPSLAVLESQVRRKTEEMDDMKESLERAVIANHEVLTEREMWRASADSWRLQAEASPQADGPSSTPQEQGRLAELLVPSAEAEAFWEREQGDAQSQVMAAIRDEMETMRASSKEVEQKRQLAAAVGKEAAMEARRTWEPMVDALLERIDALEGAGSLAQHASMAQAAAHVTHMIRRNVGTQALQHELDAVSDTLTRERDMPADVYEIELRKVKAGEGLRMELEIAARERNEMRIWELEQAHNKTIEALRNPPPPEPPENIVGAPDEEEEVGKGDVLVTASKFEAKVALLEEERDRCYDLISQLRRDSYKATASIACQMTPLEKSPSVDEDGMIGSTELLMEEIGAQLSGAEGQRGRARFESHKMGQGESYRPHDASLHQIDGTAYCKLKAQVSIERQLREGLESELEAMKVRFESGHLKSIERYEELRHQSCYKDFKRVASYGFLGVTGKDAFGTPVVVVAAGSFPKGLSFDAALQYAIFTLEPDIVDHPYHLCFLNSNNMKGKAPDVEEAWLAMAVEILPVKYRRNLQRAFLLHPSLGFKAWWWSAKSCLTKGLQNKVVMCDTVAELFENLGGRTCVLPEYVYRHEGTHDAGRELLVLAKGRTWDQTMEKIEQKAKNSLYMWDMDCLAYLQKEKIDLAAQERYADAALVMDEIQAIQAEVDTLQSEIDYLGGEWKKEPEIQKVRA